MNIKQLLVTISLFITTIMYSHIHALNTIDSTSVISNISVNGITTPFIQDHIKELTLETKENRKIKPDQLTNDINKVYLTGFFSEVSAESITSQNKHILMIQCIENPIVETIHIPNSSEKIQSIIKEHLRQPLNTPLNTLWIEEDQSTIETTIQQLGYDFFTIEDIVYKKTTQTLIINTNEGIIGSITFNTLKTLHKQTLSREMQQQPGDTLNSKQLQKDRDKLIQLGYFSSISAPTFKKSKSKGKVDIAFDVIEKKSNRLELGIEQEEDQFVGFLSNIRNHNLINSDIFLSKFQLELNNNVSNISSYVFTYTQPWTFNKYKLTSSLSYYNNEEEEIINSSRENSQRTGQSAAFTYPFNEFFSTTTTIKSEHVSPINNDSSIDRYNLNSLQLELNYSTIKNRINPRKGYYWNLEFEKGDDLGIISIGGLSFSKLAASISTFHRLSKQGTLAGRIQSGIFHPNEDNLNTFENEYFVIGGSTSLRGYNEANYPFSGTKKYLINLEYRYNFYKHMQAVFFYDIGNAFETNDDIEKYSTGHGFGLRYVTPVGPLRFDIAKGNSHTFLHFGLGQLF